MNQVLSWIMITIIIIFLFLPIVDSSEIEEQPPHIALFTECIFPEVKADSLTQEQQQKMIQVVEAMKKDSKIGEINQNKDNKFHPNSVCKYSDNPNKCSFCVIKQQEHLNYLEKKANYQPEEKVKHTVVIIIVLSIAILAMFEILYVTIKDQTKYQLHKILGLWFLILITIGIYLFIRIMLTPRPMFG